MLVLCKVIDEDTKEIIAGAIDQKELWESQGYKFQEVETCWNGKTYLKGYAPAKPQSEIIAEQVAEYKKELKEIDEKSLRATRAILVGTGTDEDKAFIAKLEEQANELRQKIRELENA